MEIDDAPAREEQMKHKIDDRLDAMNACQSMTFSTYMTRSPQESRAIPSDSQGRMRAGGPAVIHLA